ncbi:hypothetical protein A8990_12745 [Paenibacillus taihuensis]|uniref:Uncharacterized protein n=1 Tax=Paenibacillus taihuensis TaxID=1156355 RepID=A0A3D9RHP7_9BACL|nr:hypothetical protein A8990_12745 [Paenibacillus taihuensis]
MVAGMRHLNVALGNRSAGYGPFEAGENLRLTKGDHLVFDRERFPLQQVVYFDNQDFRMVFAIPRGIKRFVFLFLCIYVFMF